MRKMIRTVLGLVAIATVIGLSNRAGAVQAKTTAPVEYTWTLAALGQGGWIGGPLFEDGTVGGGGALSINNGRVVALFRPTTWTENSDDEITVCFDVIQKKGPAGALPPEICVGPNDVTGTQTHITIFGSVHIFRITENH